MTKKKIVARCRNRGITYGPTRCPPLSSPPVPSCPLLLTCSQSSYTTLFSRSARHHDSQTRTSGTCPHLYEHCSKPPARYHFGDFQRCRHPQLNITLEHGDDDNDNTELPGLRDDEEKDMSNKLLALFSPRMRANLAPEIRGVWISESGEILHTTTDEQIVPFG